eukprot:352658_1
MNRLPDPPKIVVLGADRVGKSAIVRKIVARDSIEYDSTTIEDSYTCTILIDGRTETLDVLDTITGSAEQFVPFQFHLLREADAFMIVYAINSERTFRYTWDIFRRIQRVKYDLQQRIDIVLVANKSDLYLTTIDKNKFKSRTIQATYLVNGYIRGIELFLSITVPIDINTICFGFYYREEEVSFEMGNNLAKQWNAQFIETSAKTGENIQEAFAIL